MKRINFNITLFLLTIFTLGCLNAVSSFWTKQSISSVENRTLNTKPAFTLKGIFSGVYFKEYENYFSDNFMFRDTFVGISKAITGIRGLPNRDGVYIVQHKGENIAENQKTEGTTKPNRQGGNSDNSSEQGDVKEEIKGSDDNIQQESSLPPKEQEQPKAEDGGGDVIGDLLILKDTAMEIYYFNKGGCSFYTDTLNDIQERLGSDIQLYSLLVPTQIEFLLNSKYRSMAGSQRTAIDFVNQKLDSRIKTIDAYDALKQNADKYIYFRTDHHWTALGAYYAYTAFACAIGEKPIPIEQYESTKVTGFLGSSYNATLNKRLRNNPDTIYLYKPFTKHEYHIYYEGPLKMDLLDLGHSDKSNKYRIFLSGDRPLGIITTEVKNGRKILIVKDSFANAFVPFLLPHYEEIYVVDPRQYKSDVTELLHKHGIQEVLFLNYTSAAGMKSFVELMANLFNQ